MVIKKHFHIIISLFLFFAVLGTGQAFGFWQLKSDEIGGDTLIIEVANRYNIPLELIYETWNIPAHVSPRAELAAARDEAGFSIGRFKIWVTAYVKEHHNLAPAELAALAQLENDAAELNITGAFTLQQLSYYFGIPLAEIQRKFSLPPNLPSHTTIRELREAHDVELGEIKIWIQIVSDALPYYYALQAGEPLDPDHIRGWMSLEQVSHASGMPPDYLYAQVNLMSNPAEELTLDQLEAITGITMEEIRDVVKEYYLLRPDAELAALPLNPPGTSQSAPPGTPQGNPQANPMGTPQGNPRANPMGTPQTDQDSRDPDWDGLRGNSTIDQVCDHYKIARAWLLEQLNLPEDTPGNASLRSLEIELGQVREIVGDYLETNQ